MGKIEKSIGIRAPPEKVWEMLAWDRHPEWIDAMQSVGYTSEVRTPEDKFRVGAIAHITVPPEDKSKAGAEEFDVEVTESLENEKISSRYLGIEGVQNVTSTYILKPTEGGTEMTLVYDYKVSNPILWILDKLYTYFKAGKDIEKSLEKLKNILEK